MKKTILIIVIIILVLVVGGFVVSGVLMYFAGKAVSENVNEFVQETQDVAVTNDENSTGNNEDTNNSSDDQGWPGVIPTDIPKLENVVIEGHYPLETGAKAYSINFTISKENSKYIENYISKLESNGYTQKLKDENNFGVDYYYTGTKYDINLNVVYGSGSTLYILVK